MAKKKNDLASLASYISGDDAGLPRKEFLKLVADRIKEDIGDKAEEGPDDDAFISAAKEKHVSGDGEINVDDDAIVSQSDKGAYVAAWVWVTNADAGIEEGDENDG